MDAIQSAIDTFVSFTTITLAIACYFLTGATRWLVESVAPSSKTPPISVRSWSHWWNGFVLYCLPPTWGIVLAFILRDVYSFPPGFELLRAKLLFGVVVGFLSGMIYKALKKAVFARFNLSAEDAPKDLDV